MKNMIKNLALVLVFSLLFTSNSSAYYMHKFNYFAQVEYSGYGFEILFFNPVLNTKENISTNNIYIVDQNFNKLDDLTGINFDFYRQESIGTIDIELDDIKLKPDKIYYIVVDKNILLENGEKLGVDIKKPFKVNGLYNEFIDIKNENLRYAVEYELDGKDKLSKGDLNEIYSISLSDIQKFSDLKELIYFENLQNIEFKDVDFSNWDEQDYAFLNELNNIWDYVELALVDCKIKDFDMIQKNLDLYRLCIDNCEIKNIKGISNLKNIEYIEFINSDLTKFDLEEEFSTINDLQSFIFKNCEFKNLKFLKAFEKLEILELTNSNFDLDDLDIAFENKNMLTTLIIANSNIDNIDFLEGLNDLDCLEIYGNEIKDISALNNMTELGSLDISGNKITNIDVLNNLNNIYFLDIGYNEIKDFSVLENIIDLEQLGVSKDQIEIIKANINLNKDIDIDVY